MKSKMSLISNSVWHVEMTIWDLCFNKWILLAKWLLLLLLFLFISHGCKDLNDCC